MAKKSKLQGPEVPKELKDFRNFLYLCWKRLGLPVPTEVQYEIAHWLQHGPRRMFLGAFRGVGKSWITSAFVVWLLLNDPQLNILVVSASKDRADDWTTFTLRLMQLMPETQHLLPKEGQRCSRIAFDVAPAMADHQPSVKSRGITSQLSGGRADVIIPDDIEVPNNSATQVMRDKLREMVKEFDAVLKPGGRIIYLGTPQTEDSLYFALPSGDADTEGYIKRLWPARVPPASLLPLYGHMLAPRIAKLAEDPRNANKPTDPARFDDNDLNQRELSYGRSGFAMQFMLLPNLTDAERYPLRLRDLIALDLNPEVAPERVIWTNNEINRVRNAPCVGRQGDGIFGPMEWTTAEGHAPRMVPYEGRLLTIDPSGRGKDETGWTVTYMLHGMVFLVDAGGFRNGYNDDTLSGLAEIAKSHKVGYVLIEDNFGDGMFAALLQPHLMKTYPVTVESIRATGMKEKRIIDVLEPVMNQHRLIVNRKLFEKDFESTQGLPLETAHQYQLFYQLTRVMGVKGALVHDDRLDALAHAVKYWQDQLGAGVDMAVETAREAALMKDIEEFLEMADRLEGKPRHDRWMDTQGSNGHGAIRD